MVLRLVARSVDAGITTLLNLVVVKPTSVFIWWLAAKANRTVFQHREELARRVRSARKQGRPVLFASNHVSMFDDPVVPMALFRTGPRAAAELAGLVGLLAAGWGLGQAAPFANLFAWTTFAYALAIALLGARKTWWSIGDLVNFSGSSALRAKVETTQGGALSSPRRLLLGIANPLIFLFMRTGAVRTILVDRRSGDAARAARARALNEIHAVAARGQPVWIFFEGGRSRDPDVLRPARRGIGETLLQLQAGGLQPLVIAIRQRGLERVIPLGGRRWLTRGHRIEVQWSEFEPARAYDDPQELADAVRRAVEAIRLPAPPPGSQVAGVA
jgi:1-acyl-sn-glycerol-3-phosphate acyltransferase